MRGVLLFLFFLVVYYALKTVIRSAVRTYRGEDDRRRSRVMGEEMVLDPECRTYVIKDRAITRRVNGKQWSFCSEGCAKQFEEKSRT